MFRFAWINVDGRASYRQPLTPPQSADRRAASALAPCAASRCQPSLVLALSIDSERTRSTNAAFAFSPRLAAWGGPSHSATRISASRGIRHVPSHSCGYDAAPIAKPPTPDLKHRKRRSKPALSGVAVRAHAVCYGGASPRTSAPSGASRWIQMPHNSRNCPQPRKTRVVRTARSSVPGNYLFALGKGAADVARRMVAQIPNGDG